MPLKNRRAQIQHLEARRLLAGAPIILRTTDAVQPGSEFTVNGSGMTASNLTVAIAPESAGGATSIASPVFEADFNGSGNGTGGTGDIATSGGTGVIGTGSGVTNSIGSSAPLSTASGNYLNSSVAAGSTTSPVTIATFTPTSVSNSWDALTGTVVSNGITYTTLNGGFDLLVRPDAFQAGNISWFRPIDISNINSTTGMRIILNGTANQLQFEVKTGTGTLGLGSAAGTFTGNDSWGLTGALTYIANPLVAGTTEHIAATFDTDSTGKITVKLFAVAGTGAIDTTSTVNLIATQSFYASAAVIGATPLPTGNWSLGDRYSHTQATSIDYDSVRLYNSDPGIFGSAGLPATTLYPQIVQTDVNSNFVVCQMPATAPAGVYDVWVENASGWSSPYLMNAARSLYQSDYQGYAGINIEVVGRNFDQSEFGGPTATQVRLNDGAGHIYPQAIASLNPYDVSFNIGSAAPVGTYYVEVSNDNGADWSRPSSGQTLTIKAHTGTDPLGLGVSWAQDFNWTSIFNVTAYGAKGNDTADDTTAVKSAITAASNKGGGVVYFPDGNYYISGLSLPSDVVLEGQDEYGVDIVYDGTGGSSFIRSNLGSGGVQLQGIAQLSITLSNNTNLSLRPDQFLNFGNAASNRIFVDAVNISYPYTTGDSAGSDGRRGIGLMFGASQQVLVANNHFVGWEGTMPDNTVGQYASIKNNYFEYSDGYVHCSATYSFFENNTVVIHPEYDQDSHGLFGRADAYFANNSVTGAGDASNVNNDGEPIATEGPGALFNFGNITTATSTSINVTTQIALVMPTSIPFGVLSIIITNGTGLGEIDTVTGITPAGVNASSGTITLGSPLPIMPDATSQFTLLAPLTGMTVYDNTINNSAKGIYIYGLGYDDVVARNTVANSGGIYIHAVINTQNGEANDGPSFFCRLTDNTVTGISRRGGFSGIGLNTGRFGTTSFISVQNYGTEISYNSITGNNTAVTGSGTGEAGPFSGIYAISYGYSTASNGIGTGDETNLIVQGNVLSDLKVGITLSKSDYGQVISDNTYDNQVLTFLLNSSSSSYGLSDNTLVTSDNILNTITLLGSAAGDTFNLKEDATVPNTLDVNNTTYNLASIIKVVIVGSTGSENVSYDFVNGPLTNAAGVLSQYGVTFAGGTATNTLSTINSGNGTAGTMPIGTMPIFFVATAGGTNNLNAGAGIITVPASTQGSVQSGITTDTFSEITIGAGAQVTIAGPSSGESDRALVIVNRELDLAGTTNAWTGTLDLGGNDLDVPNGNLAMLANQAAQGERQNWQASGGIISSFAAADTGHLTSLGVIQNSTTGLASGPVLYGTFDQATVLDTDVLLKYTYFGDATLDGAVDGSDYSRIDSGFLNHLSGWINGDFNGDGVINGSDYTLIDNAFNNQGARLAATVEMDQVVAASLPVSTNINFSASWNDFDQRHKKSQGIAFGSADVEAGLV